MVIIKYFKDNEKKPKRNFALVFTHVILIRINWFFQNLETEAIARRCSVK